MGEILIIIFFISLLASVYFLARLFIRMIFGGETERYRTKLVMSLGTMIISVAIFLLIGMFATEDEEDLKEDAERRLEELINENFPEQ